MTNTKNKIVDRKLRILVTIANPLDLQNAKQYNAIIDTGSMETLISKKIITDLKLTPNGSFATIIDFQDKEINTPRHDTYIQLDGHVKTYSISAAVVNKNGIDIIIGMDIIEQFELTLVNNFMIININ